MRSPAIFQITSLLAALFHSAAAAQPPVRRDQLSKCKHTAQEVVQKLNLTANPEKGYYVESFRDPDTYNNRSVSTAIYYLLEGSAGDSLWHRVDAAEVWHYYAGAPLVLSVSHDDGQPIKKVTLGGDIFDGQQPQVVIGKWEWQSAKSLGDWTLVGTTGKHVWFVLATRHFANVFTVVAPAFDPSGYEIAAADWEPKGA